MKELEELRQELATTDKALVEHFLQRMNIVDRVADHKQKAKSKVYAPEQEAKVLERVQSQMPPELAPYGRVFLETLMRLSRERQYARLIDQDQCWQLGRVLREAQGRSPQVEKVIIPKGLGRDGARVAQHMYPDASIAQAGSFDGICRQVLDGQADLAILPLQEDVFFLLEEHRLFIQACSIHADNRFLAVGRQLTVPAGEGLMGLLIRADDQVKALSLAVQVLADLNLGVVQIQPLQDSSHYLSFLAVPGNPQVVRALYQLEKEAPGMYLLGWYDQRSSSISLVNSRG